MSKPKPVKVDVQPYDEFKDFLPYTKRIRELGIGIVGNAIEIGQELLKAQADPKIKHHKTGFFVRWIEECLGFSNRQGYNFMYAAEHFGNFANFTKYISDSAMYILAAPSAPEAARDAAIGIAEQGGRVTHKKAVELVEAYRESTEEEFVLLTELAKWASTLNREYARYPERWRQNFVKETERFLENKREPKQ